MKPPRTAHKEIAELKKQTAHEEVLKAQQEALQARQRALQEQESINPCRAEERFTGRNRSLTDRERGFDRRRGRSH